MTALIEPPADIGAVVPATDERSELRDERTDGGKPTWRGRTAGPAALLVAVYVAVMPFLAGLPRGAVVPLLRPSEALQLALSVGAIVLLVPDLARGQTWRLRLRTSEWWLLATAVAASILPLLWLVVRAEPVGSDEILAAFPFVKFTALYVLVRAAVCSSGDARAILLTAVAAGLAVAAVAVAQSLGVGPVVEILGRFYAGDDAVAVDAGRGSSTIGSSIATGTYLAIAATIAVSMGFARRQRPWFSVAAALATGALASGQASTVLALGIALVVVGYLHRRVAVIVGWGVPAMLAGVAALWPIVSARLADIDQGSGLPSSWVIRWVNVTELFWPRLADGGWLLGVSPDATQAPPDVWRDVVYLESGYLWLLWVGGVPLLVTAVMFLATAYRDLRTARAATTEADPLFGALAAAGQASVVVVLVLSILDPHLTLRASADLFYVLLALGAAGVPVASDRPAAHLCWRRRLGADTPSSTNAHHARLQLAEAPSSVVEPGRLDEAVGGGIEAVVRIRVQCDQPASPEADVALVRRGSGLHGFIVGPFSSAGTGELDALLWRGVVRCSASLRLASLEFSEHGEQLTIGRRELKLAAALADDLEIERARHHDPAAVALRTGAGRPDAAPLPVRLEVPAPLPRWKRASDLIVTAVVSLVALPVAVVCAALVRRSGPGPVIFRQLRVGAAGLPFQMWKFRTMHVGNDDRAHREQNQRELLGVAAGEKPADDRRVTPVGRWLRRLSLDELPQLVNVVRGEMSLVGPRPSLLWEVELYASPARRRLHVRPGVTGLWQTGGRGDVSMLQMLELDLDYVDSVSAGVDLRCLVATARSVVAGEGAA